MLNEIDFAIKTLLWCFILNYGILVFWFVLFLLPHKWLYRASLFPFKVSEEEFDKINLTGIVYYKIAILLFNLAPYIALQIAKQA